MCSLRSEATIGERLAASQVSERSVERAVAARCINRREQSWSAGEFRITCLPTSNHINMDRRFDSCRVSLHIRRESLALAPGQVDRRYCFHARTRSLINAASGAARV
jgi:hypothetical protein